MIHANRFNQVGQAAWYLGSDEKTAAVEVLREPVPRKLFYVAQIDILEPLHVLDLTMGTWGEDPSGDWILRNVVDRRFVSELTDKSDESCPQYRIPQYMADLARREGFQGILYDSSRPSAYNNPEAVGRNLVVFEPDPSHRILSRGEFQFGEPNHNGFWGDERWPVRPLNLTTG